MSLAIAEINSGINPALTVWKGRTTAFTRAYQAQFTAYTQGVYPFNAPMGVDENPLSWWEALEGSANAGIIAVRGIFLFCTLSTSKLLLTMTRYSTLQALALKSFSAAPHSMADECTISVINLMNSALRNQKKVQILVPMTQIRITEPSRSC